MAAPNGPPDQQEIPAKSGPSSVPSFLRFINRTPRLVDVIWLNYDGIRIRYKTLPPNGFGFILYFTSSPTAKQGRHGHLADVTQETSHVE